MKFMIVIGAFGYVGVASFLKAAESFGVLEEAPLPLPLWAPPIVAVVGSIIMFIELRRKAAQNSPQAGEPTEESESTERSETPEEADSR